MLRSGALSAQGTMSIKNPEGHLPQIMMMIILAILGSASGVQGAYTTESCIAAKLKAAGQMQKCRRTEEAKQWLGKPADAAECINRFESKLARLDLLASGSGLPCRYAYLGGGVVKDLNTGLEWEQKSNLDGGSNYGHPSDADNLYNWSHTESEADGFVFIQFLSRLNGAIDGGGVGGYKDWRIPTVQELTTILNCAYPVCADPSLGPTKPWLYWTSSTDSFDPGFAWAVNFGTGQVEKRDKYNEIVYVRAVRGGW
jgi:hypothetical protein